MEAVKQPLLYAGYWYDRELHAPNATTGWYWLSVRPYNPALKRFTQPDPSMQEGIRSYVYVGDDPVDATDPSGLACEYGGGIPGGGGAGGDDAPPGEPESPPPVDDPSYIFRGDNNREPNSAVGSALDPASEPPQAQEFIDHVRQVKGKVARFVSFSRSLRSATRFGRPIKVNFGQLRTLEAQGKIRIYNADQVERIINDDRDPRIKRNASSTKKMMENNQEILIEGEIPSDLIRKAKP